MTVNRTAWGAAFLVGLCLALAAGVRFGVTVGVDQFLKMDSSVKASVLTTELRGLRGGNVDRVIELKEIELDGYVVSALAFQESGMPWLFWPNDRVWNHHRSLATVATYRKQYPPVVPIVAKSTSADDPGGLGQFANEVERSTRTLIERYAK